MNIVSRDRLTVIALISLILAIATPVSVYRTNADEFKFGLLEFLPTSLILFLVVVTVVAAGERLVRPLLGPTRVFVALSCLFYLLWLQANVLQWPYGSLEQGDWYHKWHYGVIDGAIWIAVLALGITCKSQRRATCSASWDLPGADLGDTLRVKRLNRLTE